MRARLARLRTISPRSLALRTRSCVHAYVRVAARSYSRATAHCLTMPQGSDLRSIARSRSRDRSHTPRTFVCDVTHADVRGVRIRTCDSNHIIVQRHTIACVSVCRASSAGALMANIPIFTPRSTSRYTTAKSREVGSSMIPRRARTPWGDACAHACFHPLEGEAWLAFRYRSPGSHDIGGGCAIPHPLA